MNLFVRLTVEVAEAQNGELTCSKAHSKGVACFLTPDSLSLP